MKDTIPMIVMYGGGIVFGFGLALAGAARPEVVLSFLHLEDLGLLFVLGTALVVTLVTFQVVPRLVTKPPLGDHYSKKSNSPITQRSIVGAVIFGVGWGISGLCPATSITAVGMGNAPVVLGVVGMFLGALLYGVIRSRNT